MMIKLVLQGVKFAYITRKYLGQFDSFLKLTGVRVGSRIYQIYNSDVYWSRIYCDLLFHKKGVKPSKSTWIAIMDIVTEVWLAAYYL